jgi:ribosomal protein L11 methyltransferase
VCVEIPPRWRIVHAPGAAAGDPFELAIDPGPGFGDGRHETTHLCLQALAALSPRSRAWTLLDFGSGSGILSIAGARLGATVDAVEIDPAAAVHGERNARVNEVAARIRPMRTLAGAAPAFDFVVANILRGVLLDFAAPLAARVASGGTLVLSGLVSTDVPEVGARYAALLGEQRAEVYARGEWRALVWRGVATSPSA